MINKIICPKCKSEEIIKWGKRKTENRGKVQRYCCKSCSETFVSDVFSKMRNTPEKITCALDLFYRGLSTREVQRHFKAFFPHNSSNVSIYKWIKKFSLKIAYPPTDKLTENAHRNIYNACFFNKIFFSQNIFKLCWFCEE